MILKPILDNWQYLLMGVLTTAALSIAAFAFSLVVGGLFGILRCYGPRWIKWIVVFYIDSMRALPLLAVIIWVFYVPPILFDSSFPPFLAALVALTAHISATVAEIVRAGIESVRIGQSSAAISLGMSPTQRVMHVILPQAMVRMIPAYGNIATITVKDTALAGVIGVADLMHRSGTVAAASFQPAVVLTCAMLAYFVIMYPITRGSDRIYRRIAFLGRS